MWKKIAIVSVLVAGVGAFADHTGDVSASVANGYCLGLFVGSTYDTDYTKEQNSIKYNVCTSAFLTGVSLQKSAYSQNRHNIAVNKCLETYPIGEISDEALRSDDASILFTQITTRREACIAGVMKQVEQQ